MFSYSFAFMKNNGNFVSVIWHYRFKCRIKFYIGIWFDIKKKLL